MNNQSTVRVAGVAVPCLMAALAAVLPTTASADGYYDHHQGPGEVIGTIITMPFVAAGVVLNTAAALATAPFTGRFEGPLGPAFNPQLGPRQAYYGPQPSYYAPPPRVSYAPPAPAYYAQPAPAYYQQPRVVYRPYYNPAPVYYQQGPGGY